MPTIELHMVIEDSNHFGSGRLWKRYFQTSFLPVVGSRVMIFSYEDSPNDGFDVEVKNVYWGTDGSVVVELRNGVINPSELMERHVGSLYSSSLWAWRESDTSVDLMAKLRDTGWR